MAELGNSRHSYCRLCLNVGYESLLNVFDESAKDKGLPQKILEMVAIQITNNDMVSTMVCDQCILKVNSWHSYKEECFHNQSKLHGMNHSFSHPRFGEEPPVIKMEPTYLESDEDVPETEMINFPEIQNGDMHPSELTNEFRIKAEPMEEEYNELPPQLSPHTPQFNLLDSEDSQNSTAGPMNSRKCRYCNKLFSSAGNRMRHEKILHGIARVVTTPASENGSIADDQSQNSIDSQENTEPEVNPMSEIDEAEQRKIQFAAGLKLLQKDATLISMEPLSKIELSYIEKCKAMVNMYSTLECACHNVVHPNVKGLLSHLRALRIWFPVFTCYNCMITFTDRSHFTRHNVACRKAPLETITRLSNLKHRSTVKTRLYQNYKCTTCKFMYSFHEEFCKHVDEEHVHALPPYSCSCTRTFTDLDEYKDHIYVSCLVEYYCDICFVTVKTLDAFQKHAKDVHDDSEGFILLQDDNYKLRRSLNAKEKCEKVKTEDIIVTGKRRSSFYTKPPILDIDDEEEPKKKKHVPAPPMNLNRPGLCPICIKEYSSYHNMLRHYRTHSEVRSSQDDSLYSCPDCGGMFSTTQWQKHLLDNHESKTCDDCGKLFQFQTELEQHRSVHLNLKISRDSKTQSYTSTMVSPNAEGGEVLMMCEICDAMFATKEDLKLHKLTHDVIVKTEPPDEEVKERKYSCKECNKHYTGYSGLWDHNKKKHPEMKTPSSNFPKQCKYCDKVCTTGAAYHIHKQMHERMNHIAQDEVKETKTIVPKEEVEDDDDEEEVESYHTCKRCFKVFSSKYNLKNHMKCHGISPTAKASKALSGIKKVWCDVCHISCDSMEGLQQHKDEEHGVDEEMPDLENEIDNLDEKIPFIFTCDVCVMTFTNKIALRKHKETHRDEKPSMLAGLKPSVTVYCKHCKIAFDSVAKLSNHMREEHDEILRTKLNKQKEKKPFVCSLCNKGFNTALALNAHSGWHKRSTPSSVKPAKLLKQNKILNKLATSAINKQQAANHTPSSGFQCSTCLQELPNDTALQIHILEKHRNINAIMLVPRCNTCNQDFNNQEEYETHKRLHDLLERQKKHEALQVKPVQNIAMPQTSSKGHKQIVKNFHCAYCPAAFSRHDTFMAHMRQNHKEFVQNEYKCNQCERVFEKQNSLTIHLKMHDKQKSVNNTGKSLFSCSICNMGFDLPKDLRTHTINAHPF